jgi:hypothetical protein
MSDYYDHGSTPSQGSPGSSATLRAEFDAIASGISNKLAPLTGNGGKIVAINATATAQEALSSTGTGSVVRAVSPVLTTPTGIVKADVGLANVDNTSDINKPVSTAQIAAFAAKGTLVSSGITGAEASLQSIDYTLAGNALTLKLNPTNLDFRSTTLTTGVPTNVGTATQLTTTISSGSTAGAVSAVQSDIIYIAINNAGTMELAWTNAAGGLNLDETNLITTVAEGGAGAADSANVIYSTTARTNVAYRVVGLYRSTQTTAGAWAQTPTLVQGMGGQALIALNDGANQSNPTRALGITYYNTTGATLYVTVAAVTSAATFFGTIITVGGFTYPTDVTHANAPGFVCVRTFKVKRNRSYVVAMNNATLQSWVEEN